MNLKSISKICFYFSAICLSEKHASSPNKVCDAQLRLGYLSVSKVKDIIEKLRIIKATKTPSILLIVVSFVALKKASVI